MNCDLKELKVIYLLIDSAMQILYGRSSSCLAITLTVMSVYKANIIRYGQQGMWCFLYYLSVLIIVGKCLLGLHEPAPDT